MKKSLILLASFMLTLHYTHAEDWAFALEGNAEQRERLSSLHGCKEPPRLQLSDWQNSDELKLEDLKGKIVVLNFWATWCRHCIGGIGANNSLQEKYADDVVLISICHPRGSEKMIQVMEKHGIKYPIAIDRDGKTIDAYKANDWPDTYVIDRDGSLVIADCDTKKLDKVLTMLISQQARGIRHTAETAE